MNYKYRPITETFFQWTIHEKLFVIKQSKGCKFMLKMHHKTFGGTSWGAATMGPTSKGDGR